MKLSDAQIKHMVDRFLCWRLPENLNPDAGISFKPTFNDHLPTPMRHEPTGTNLFDVGQTDAMVRHLAEGMPADEMLVAALPYLERQHAMTRGGLARSKLLGLIEKVRDAVGVGRPVPHHGSGP